MQVETIPAEATREDMRAFWLRIWGFVPGQRDEHDEAAEKALAKIEAALHPIVFGTRRGVMIDDEELTPFAVAHFLTLVLHVLQGEDNRFRKRIIRAVDDYTKHGQTTMRHLV